MKILNLFLNYSCNAKCPFCFNPAQPSPAEWKGMSTPKAVFVLLEAFSRGCRSVSFIGGEATVRPDFPKLVAAARRIGYEDLRLVTNGFKLADPAYARLLVRAGMRGFDVSFHSHIPEVQDLLLGAPKAFERAAAALENIRRHHPVRLGVNFVINRANYRGIAESVSYLRRRHDVRNFSFFSMRYIGHMAAAKAGSGLEVSLAESAPYLVKALELLQREDCLSGTCVGDFVPCLLPGYESLMTDWECGANLDEVAHPDGRFEPSDAVCSDGKRQVPACGGCVYRDRCQGVNEAYLERFGPSEFRALGTLPAARIVRTGRILS